MMRAHTSPVDHHCVHVVRVGDGVRNPVPVARIAPPVEAIIDRCQWAIFAGQIGPRDVSAQDVEDAVDHATVIHPLLTPCLVRQDDFDEFPFQIAHVSSRHLSSPARCLDEMTHKPMPANKN